jgi:hypothetical protein
MEQNNSTNSYPKTLLTQIHQPSFRELFITILNSVQELPPRYSRECYLRAIFNHFNNFKTATEHLIISTGNDPTILNRSDLHQSIINILFCLLMLFSKCPNISDNERFLLDKLYSLFCSLNISHPNEKALSSISYNSEAFFLFCIDQNFRQLNEDIQSLGSLGECLQVITFLGWILTSLQIFSKQVYNQNSGSSEVDLNGLFFNLQI